LIFEVSLFFLGFGLGFLVFLRMLVAPFSGEEVDMTVAVQDRGV
jgi:hypothetical protein